LVKIGNDIILISLSLGQNKCWGNEKVFLLSETRQLGQSFNPVKKKMKKIQFRWKTDENFGDFLILFDTKVM